MQMPGRRRPRRELSRISRSSLSAFARQLLPRTHLNFKRIKHMQKFVELGAKFPGACIAVHLGIFLVVQHFAIPLPLNFDS